MDTSAYALTHGLRTTRATLHGWRARPGPVLRRWVVASVAAAVALLFAVLIIAALVPVGVHYGGLGAPPFAPGSAADVLSLLRRNLLVLALHAMACVAGFIAGSSLPLQAAQQTGLRRQVHERGRAIALACVVAATVFSLSWQAFVLGHGVAGVSVVFHVSPVLLLVGLLPHALPELTALFLPLAAWILASRRREWDQLLAATLVTVALALPVLVATATWEVFVAPHVLAAIIGSH